MAVELCVGEMETDIMLAKFVNGNLLNCNSLKDVKLYRNTRSNPNHKILVAGTERAQYRGTNFGPTARHFSSLCRNYVGILDKTTNKMHIVSPDWFNMNSTFNDIRRLDDVKTEEETTKEKESEPTTRKEKNDELTMSFGSRQKQKSIESKRKLLVLMEDLSAKMQQEISDVVVTEPSPQMEATAAVEDLLPPINRDAETEADICNVNDFVSNDDLDLLVEQAMILSDRSEEDLATWRKNKTYPYFVLNALSYLTAEQETRLHKCKLFAYYSCLAALLSVKNTDLKKKNPLSEAIPEPLRHKLAVEYFQSAGSGKNKWKRISDKGKDKVGAQMIALALILDEFRTEAKNLQMDLKFAQKKFQVLVQVLGAKLLKPMGRVVKNRQSPDMISWEVPLPKLKPIKKLAKLK